MKRMDSPNKSLFPSLTIVDDATAAESAAAVSRNGTEPEGSRHSHMVIIGSGPAGLTAAIYAARANLRPIVIIGSIPGGQLMITSDVENYPGFPEEIQGPELMQMFPRAGRAFRLAARRPRRGAGRPVRPAIPAVGRRRGVHRRLGRRRHWRVRRYGSDSTARRACVAEGVSACATCDGFFFRGKKVAVVGGGDTALEEATFLTRFASDVVLIHRRDRLRGSKIMQERALANPKINVLWNKEVVDVLGDDVVTGLRLRDTVTGDETDEPMEGLFVAIGYRPNTSVFRDWLETDDKGYLVATDHARIDGVFVAGDVHDHRYRQRSPPLAMAAGQQSTPNAGLRPKASPRRQPPPPGKGRWSA